jgi:dynein heavy chain
VKLCSVGYGKFVDLARKFSILYSLCEQQLSKQKHYDFGLRNILSVLRTAGQTKRDNINEPNEDLLLMRTLRDMNLSKLAAVDIPLFLSLLSDLFPTAGNPPTETNETLAKAIAGSIKNNGLVHHDSWVLKVTQLYDTTLVRHGIMVVGPPGSGKSRMISTLQEAYQSMLGVPHKQVRMNPKAIRAEEMFGETDRLSNEWVDGIFAAMWSKFNDRTRKDITWITCDGPVDAVWIENLNTVLDDNKILTLANGDRIPMTDNVKLMFEVEDLRNASPATVSRAGIIFVSETDLDWWPTMEGWAQKRPASQAAFLREYFKRYVSQRGDEKSDAAGPDSSGAIFRFLSKNCRPVIQSQRVALIESQLTLLTFLLDDCDLSESLEDVAGEIERVFLFSLAWTVGGLLESEDRVKFDAYLREISTNMPPVHVNAGAGSRPSTADPNATPDTIYEYCVNKETLEWERWKPPEWSYPRLESEHMKLDFANMRVPTVDSTRAVFLLHCYHHQKRPAMMIGSAGTAKTVTALMFFDEIARGLASGVGAGGGKGAEIAKPESAKRLNFSSATTAGLFQETIEGELDKRGGKNFGPPSGKRMTVFLDDISMPEVNNWGDQPTLELVRQLVESGGFCFLDKDKRGDVKVIEDLFFMAAMNQPGGGKNDIPNRLKRQFSIFNMTVPSTATIDEIYGQMVRGWYTGVPDLKKNVVETLSRLMPATIKLWSWTKKNMLPTPTKFHYVFSMRELSSVTQGILRLQLSPAINEKYLIKLWRHECERVFADKLISNEDKAKWQQFTNAMTESDFGKISPKDKVELQDSALFVDFLREDEYDEDGLLVNEAPKVYELGGTAAQLKERLVNFLKLYGRPQSRLSTDYFVLEYLFWLIILYWNILIDRILCTGISLLAEQFVLEYPY